MAGQQTEWSSANHAHQQYVQQQFAGQQKSTGYGNGKSNFLANGFPLTPPSQGLHDREPYTPIRNQQHPQGSPYQPRSSEGSPYQPRSSSGSRASQAPDNSPDYAEQWARYYYLQQQSQASPEVLIPQHKPQTPTQAMQSYQPPALRDGNPKIPDTRLRDFFAMNGTGNNPPGSCTDKSPMPRAESADIRPPMGRPPSQIVVPNGMHKVALPGWFVSNEEFLDTTLIGATKTWEGMRFRRHIESTPWSRKLGIAGIPMEQLPITALSYRGWAELSLRFLSFGKYICMIFCRHPAEAVLVQRLLSAIREKGWDIDIIAENIKSQVPVPTISPQPPTAIDANTAIAPMIKSIIDHLAPYAEVSLIIDQAARIKELEAQLATSTIPRADPGLPILEPEGPANVPAPAVEVPQLNPDLAWNPTCRILADTHGGCPAFSDRAINQWLKRIHTDMTAAKIATLNVYIIAVEEAFTNLKKSTKPKLLDICTNWGIPASIATRMSQGSIIKLCATAAFMSS
jgi:hypothetical protein